MSSVSTVEAWTKVLDFILEYRRKEAFRNYSNDEIMSVVLEAFKVDGLALLREGNRYTAIAVGFPQRQFKVLHIHTIITTEANDIIYLVNEYFKRFPGFRITAKRKGKYIQYNTPKLLKHLWATKDKVL